MIIAELLTVTLITLLAAISPGPDFAMVSRNSVIYSRRAGIYTAVGIGLGVVVHILYCLIGIGFIIAQSIILFNVIKYLGAGYLIYIGYKSLRTKPSVKAEDKILQQDHNRNGWFYIKMGLLTNALNPKATIFFLSLFTQVINPSTPFGIQLLYGIEAVIIVTVWFVVLAWFLSQGAIKERISGIQHYFEKIMGAALIALGLKVAFSSPK